MIYIFMVRENPSIVKMLNKLSGKLWLGYHVKVSNTLKKNHMAEIVIKKTINTKSINNEANWTI